MASGIEVAETIRRLDERGYARAAVRVIRTITASTNAGEVARRLKDLDAEAKRLVDLGERLTRSNPFYQALLRAFEQAAQANGAVMAAAGEPVMSAGAARADAIVRFGIARGTPARLRATVNSLWRTPDIERVLRLLGYVDSGAWGAEVRHFVNGSIQAVDNVALRGAAANWHPVRVARELRGLVQETHHKAANTLLRTLYLESARKATAINQAANEDIMDAVIRIEALDDRTCMACVGLHGDVIWRTGDGPVPPIEEHHNGRGTTIVQVKGVNLRIESGERWFARQSADKQRRQIGSEKGYEAYREGRVRAKDFAHPYQNAVFGDMVRQASVDQALQNAEQR